MKAVHCPGTSKTGLNVLLLYSITECKPCWKAPLPKGTKTLVNIEHFTGTPAYMHYKGRPIRIHRGEHLHINATPLQKAGRQDSCSQVFRDMRLFFALLGFCLGLVSGITWEWIKILKVLHHHVGVASGLTVEEELWMDSSEIPNPGPQDQATK